MSGEAAVIGVGMHPWGKWGHSFIEYAVVAARAALRDAGVSLTDVDFIAGAGTVRNGYPGYVPAAVIGRALGWHGERISSSYAACASGLMALDAARAQVQAGLADVALVIGSDTTPKGWLAPADGDRPTDPDWLRFRAVGVTNPAYFALGARRRMALHGATNDDFAAVKAKNSRHGALNPYARYRIPVSVEDVTASPVVSDPLHLLDICATSDGAAAVVVVSAERARRLGATPVRIAGLCVTTPAYPHTGLDMPDLATALPSGENVRGFKSELADRVYAEAGIGPDDLSCAEVYDLATSTELDWYEQVGLCPVGEAEALLHSGATSLGGRVPVNPSGGLASFGEAVPAQAIAQVCELTWQLRGQAGHRQVPGARVGLAINQGLFGHGSAVVLTR